MRRPGARGRDCTRRSPATQAPSGAPSGNRRERNFRAVMARWGRGWHGPANETRWAPWLDYLPPDSRLLLTILRTNESFFSQGAFFPRLGSPRVQVLLGSRSRDSQRGTPVGSVASTFRCGNVQLPAGPAATGNRSRTPPAMRVFPSARAGDVRDPTACGDDSPSP